MNISLPPELEKFIADKMATGLYDSPNQVIIDGLQLLRDQDLFREMRLNELRGLMQEGTLGEPLPVPTPDEMKARLMERHGNQAA